MTEENEILPENKNVTMTIKVEKEAEPEPPVELPYEDVKESDWYYNAVYFNYIEKTMTGLDNTLWTESESGKSTVRNYPVPHERRTESRVQGDIPGCGR